ncbi:MAG: RagB/SusD family nutrient uptake outer membrane protein [Microscillaceae bacterium]|nr:RagB/SusD family nutrient uptake outer membrane protein [Microscillaceae bacterium]
MKNINLMYLFAGLLILSSCDKRLDIEPAQSISPEEALSTSKGVQATLIGAYASMGDADVYGGRVYVAPDLLADNGDVTWSGTFQGLTQIFNKEIPIDNGFVEDTWLDSYEVINVANNVLSAIDVVIEADQERVEGEAKFIRGSIYFELIKLYAKTYQDGSPASNPGVPIVLEPTRGVTEGPARNTVEEVYTQIIADLTDAEGLLPESNGFFANKYAATAMLSRVYLMQGNYAAARDAADRVISSDEFELVDYYPDEFPYPGQVRVDNTSEDIYAQQVSDQNGTNSLNQFYASSADGGRGDIQIENQHLDLYEDDDERLDLFFNDDGSIRTGKFSNVFGNVKIIRLAEMYLTRAEANFRLGTSVGATALEDINTIRDRVGLDDLTALTLDDILKERYLELAFEGQFLHDIKRTQGSVGNLPWNSPKLVYPIPQRELIVNPNLVQNEGY